MAGKRTIAWLQRAPLSAMLLVSACGGGGGGGGVVVTAPTPTPTSTPTPTPVPTPTPGTATISFLHVFSITPGDGAQPNGPLLQASDGNFYGTTLAGGANSCAGPNNYPCGVVYRMTSMGDVVVLHDFGASATDGYSPGAPLIQGRDGALYGLTTAGGAFGNGTLYRITLDGSYSILYSFGGTPGDGLVPLGGVVQASDGSFYGTTAAGGSNHCVNIPMSGANCGTTFRVTPAGNETVLYSFGASESDGVEPNGTLLLAADGNFYGTTQNGGTNACSQTGGTHNCGTVFRMTPAGVVSVLYSFGATLADPLAPQGALIQGRDGAFYGTTASGGGGSCGWWAGCGTVFRMTAAGKVTVLHAFAQNGRTDGDGPAPYLIQGRDGNFYGTTNSGGAYAADLNGTVFQLTPAGAKTILYSFGPLNVNPSNPLGGVIQASDGAFYGVTRDNGTLGQVGARGGAGTVFRLSLP